MAELQPIRSGLARRRWEGILARIDSRTELAEHENDREAELAMHKQQNLDWVTLVRMQGVVQVGKAAVSAIEQCPQIHDLVVGALRDHQLASGRIYFKLACK